MTLTAVSGSSVLSLAGNTPGGTTLNMQGPGYGTSSDGIEMYGYGSAGTIQGSTGLTTIGISGVGLLTVAEGSGPAFVASTQEGTGPVMIGQANNSDVMSLDQIGNMILAGSLTENGTPLVAHRQPNGWGVGTYSAQQTSRTVEDLGEAQLQGGQAYVHLDPAFASVTDTRRTYLVFITPQGNCHGVYVTQKTSAGFEVQEMDEGQSSIAFDYRIVAPSRDSAGVRLPMIPPIRNYPVRILALPARHSFAVVKPFIRSMPAIRAGYVPSNNH